MNPMKRLLGLFAVLTVCGSFFPAQGEEPPPRKIHMISGSREYPSKKSLIALKAYLKKHYRVEHTLPLATDKGSDIPEIKALEDAIITKNVLSGKLDRERP